jgi:RNA polymerase sigma factor (sigma-70 family)
MILTYHPDFNTFYKKNLAELKTFLWPMAWKYQHIIEPEDMVQEILLRLLKSTVLQDWDKTKSALNTFITTRIRGYALHIITKKIQKEPKSKYMVRLDRYHEYGDIDGEPNGNGYFIELSSEGLEEMELYVEEIKELFKEKIGLIPYEIYDLHYWQGYTFHEVVSIMNDKYDTELSYSNVYIICNETTQSLLKILSKEGVHCGQ